MNPATRAAVAGIRRRPRQTLLTGLAVLVATAFAAAAVLVTETVREAMLSDAARTPAPTSFVVDRLGGGDVPRVAEVPGGADTVLLTPRDAAGPGLPVSRVDVVGEPDRAALEAAAPGARVRTAGEARAAETAVASQTATSVLAGLSVFVGPALVAAAVVVGSAFRIVLGRRGRELALLRCVGAGRGQVTRSVLAEAGLTGLAAGVPGTVLATGATYAALAVAQASGVDVPFPALPVAGLLGCVLVAVVATVVAALRPAAARSGAASLAVANARRLSRRTAATTTVLALGVGLTAALAVGIDGATVDARSTIERTYPADVLVLTADGSARQVSDLAGRLDARPELRVRTDDTEVLVDGAPGVAPDAVRAAVGHATDGSGATVVWAADMRAETERVFGTVRLVGSGLVGVTLVVAALGVGVTLALSVAGRTREIALLRALGLTRSGARRSVAAEAALAGVVAAVLGVVLGALYGALGLRAIGMGVPVPPAGQLAALGAGVVAVAVLASVASMRRAGRVELAHGIAAG